MNEITEKAKEVVASISKDFHDDEAMAVLEIAKILLEIDC